MPYYLFEGPSNYPWVDQILKAALRGGSAVVTVVATPIKGTAKLVSKPWRKRTRFNSAQQQQQSQLSTEDKTNHDPYLTDPSQVEISYHVTPNSPIMDIRYKKVTAFGQRRLLSEPHMVINPTNSTPPNNINNTEPKIKKPLTLFTLINGNDPIIVQISTSAVLRVLLLSTLFTMLWPYFLNPILCAVFITITVATCFIEWTFITFNIAFDLAIFIDTTFQIVTQSEFDTVLNQIISLPTRQNVFLFSIMGIGTVLSQYYTPHTWGKIYYVMLYHIVCPLLMVLLFDTSRHGLMLQMVILFCRLGVYITRKGKVTFKFI
jgi:hypothetical protein